MPCEAHGAMLVSQHSLERASIQALRGSSDVVSVDARGVDPRDGVLGRGTVPEVARRRPTVLVVPAAALAHAEQHRHRLRPRTGLAGITTLRASVVWDLPGPIELDVGPWRCRTC